MFKLSHEQLVAHFVSEGIEGQASNMFIKGNKLYSYGEHYVLAERLSPMIKFQTSYDFVVNGERYSNSTAKHQARTRNGIYPKRYIILPDASYQEQSLIEYLASKNQELEKVRQYQGKLKKRGPRFFQYQNKIVRLEERIKEVHSFKISLYGTQAIDFIRSD